MDQFVYPNNQFVSVTGAPSIGWKFYVYDTGTSNLASIYSNSALTITAANPVTADAKGFFATFFWSGTVDVVLKDENGNVINSASGITDLTTEILQVITSLNNAIPYGVAAGSGDAITATISSIGTSDFSDGAMLIIKANAACTGAANTPNLLINALPNRRIKKLGGSALVANDIISGMYCLLVFNHTQDCYYLLNPNATYLNRDGSAAMSADLPMGSHKITGLAAGVAATDALNITQAQDSGYNYIAAGGSANAITAAFSPAYTAYTAGQIYRVKTASPNTAQAVTIDVNGLGAKTIVRSDGSPLMVGDIRSGAIIELMYDGTNMQLLVPAAGLWNTGQCQLNLTGGNLVLTPKNGNQMVNSGIVYAIPDAGVSLTTAGVSPNTTYYIYEYINSGNMALEFSATAYATESGTGQTIKSGDASRAFVGLGRTNGSSQWGMCRSWYNDPGYTLTANFSANRGTNSSSYAELNSEIECGFLAFSDEIVTVTANGGCLLELTPGDDGYAYLGIAYDTGSGITIEDGTNVIGASVTGELGSNNWHPMSFTNRKTGLSTGYHFATIVGKTVLTAGSQPYVYCNGSATQGQRTTLTVFCKR